MLTIHQIIELHKNGYSLKLKRNPPLRFQKGQYFNKQAIVYTRDHDSQKDLEFTIIHELLHARNDLRCYKKIDTEKIVHKETQQTLKERPYIIDFIKWIYQIK